MFRETVGFISQLTNTAHVIGPLGILAVGALLLVGWLTPIAAGAAFLIDCWLAYSRPEDLWPASLAAGISFAVSMVGPGAWSIDAIAYGRRRISLDG